MKVTGAQFRVDQSGPNKGKLSIMVKGTLRSAYVSKQEMQAQDTVGTTAARNPP